MGRGPARPVSFSSHGPRPGPAHHNFPFGTARPGPDRRPMTSPGNNGVFFSAGYSNGHLTRIRNRSWPRLDFLFERSEFLIATCKKKKTDSLCVYVRLILVLVLGRQIVYGQNTVYLCLSKYIVFENTAVQASCGEKHSTEWSLPTWCPQRRSPLVPSRTDSSNLHVI